METATATKQRSTKVVKLIKEPKTNLQIDKKRESNQLDKKMESRLDSGDRR